MFYSWTGQQQSAEIKYIYLLFWHLFESVFHCHHSFLPLPQPCHSPQCCQTPQFHLLVSHLQQIITQIIEPSCRSMLFALECWGIEIQPLVMRGTPPGKVISPWLECSMLNRLAPGWQGWEVQEQKKGKSCCTCESAPISSVSIWKNTAVFAWGSFWGDESSKIYFLWTQSFQQLKVLLED